MKWDKIVFERDRVNGGARRRLENSFPSDDYEIKNYQFLFFRNFIMQYCINNSVIIE